MNGRPSASPDGERKAICYLCGLPFEGKRDKEHVVARQIFPSGIRKRHKLNLLTLPAHKACNEAYQADEVYFSHSIGPLAKDTEAGRALMADLQSYFKYPAGRVLSQKVLKEFQWEINGVVLPPGRVAKGFDGGRVDRVIWKILRGLFFEEKGRFLPEHSLRHPRIYSPHDPPPPEETEWLKVETGHTKHAAVFDYKFIERSTRDGHVAHEWALLFWDFLMWIVTFHDPSCRCAGCITLRETYPIPPSAI